jgi:hypothetical protein
MKTYYISTNPEYYGPFVTCETARAEAEEIADVVVENFPNITTTFVPNNKGYNNLNDNEISKVHHWIEKNWIDILNNVGIY